MVLGCQITNKGNAYILMYDFAFEEISSRGKSALNNSAFKAVAAASTSKV